MLTIKVIDYQSQAYWSAVRLREEILRKPLGLKFLPEELEQEKEHIHVAGFYKDKICATAALVPEGTALKMQRVAVRVDLQGRGFGSELLTFCEQLAAKRGFKSIFCHARDSAIPFYLKNHYLLEGDPFDEDGIPHQVMRKTLENYNASRSS